MTIISRTFAAIALLVLASAALAQETTTPDIEMWRLDCGTIEIADLDAFSDGFLYEGERFTATDSCYLVRNGDRHLLWDAGLPTDLIGNETTSSIFTLSLERGIVDQLDEIGLAAEDITFLGLSHHHFDHVAQAPAFANATLLMNNRDIALLRAGGNADTTALLAPWLEGGGKVADFAGDHDVFGDGSVVILAMPGHTPGHSSLLVRLPETGPVLLTGDLYHFHAQIENRGVPRFNVDRADTLASFARFEQIKGALGATVIVQHDPADIDKLPAFPASAR